MPYLLYIQGYLVALYSDERPFHRLMFGCNHKLLVQRLENPMVSICRFSIVLDLRSIESQLQCRFGTLAMPNIPKNVRPRGANVASCSSRLPLIPIYIHR
jgi:hypothetical protein